MTELADVEVQKLTKRHVDDLVAALRSGGLKSPKDRKRKKSSPRSVNYMLGLLTAVLEDQVQQGRVARNVARLVARIPASPKPPDTLTAAEVEKILKHIETDRDAIAWQLALAGLRRGEIAGLRWSDIDLDAGTLTVAQNRISYSKTIVEGTPKSRASRRVLPLPDRLAAALRTAKLQQAADRLAIGATYRASGYVVVDQAGRPLTPATLTFRWGQMLKAAKVRQVRLHDARHTCGTLMHLDKVPIAVIAAWLGHASSAFTLSTYTHAQPEALADAAQSFARVVTIRDNSGPKRGS
jgi:integrase